MRQRIQGWMNMGLCGLTPRSALGLTLAATALAPACGGEPETNVDSVQQAVVPAPSKPVRTPSRPLGSCIDVKLLSKLVNTSAEQPTGVGLAVALGATPGECTCWGVAAAVGAAGVGPTDAAGIDQVSCSPCVWFSR